MKISREAILWYAIQYDGDWKKIGNAIKAHENYSIITYPYAYFTIVDDEYPDAFKKLRYPPWIIFYQGDLGLLKEKGVGIVGARNCSLQALQNTDLIVKRLQSKYVIVSGLAKGIDARAHQNAIRTIGVLGCGINVIYPKENTFLFERMKYTGLIISEYPMHVKPLAYHFPWRNRLIAALSYSLVVIEASYKSGTMITVNECLELSVPIYCVPTAFQDEKHQGCNYLISNGANILVDIKDVDDI
ncbi:DNA-processing protein DprA [uncultured Holdemanella sp.]|jgi:DNA processing protein|uniref:DNA-processing protein DprA n=1 Tax=uncultured Holdemanella sp. TaxID=1763549 RepID=UPI0025F89F92|nr:DNA-processing protein DprA [uncultured Holdemanella sp.]